MSLAAALFAASSALAQSSAPTRPQVSISLAPPFIEKAVRASGKLNDSISLTNNSLVPVMVTVDFADFRVSEEGQVEEMPPGTDPSSLAAYLRISPLKLRVEPQGRVFFRYAVQAPDAFTQLRTQIFFSSTPIIPNSPNQVLFVPRMGIPLYVENLAAKAASLNIGQVEWRRSPNNETLQLEMSLANEGDRNIRPKGFVEVRSSDGKFTKTFAFNDGNEPVLPRQKRTWTRSFGPVPGGELSVRLRFETSARTSFDKQYRVAASGS